MRIWFLLISAGCLLGTAFSQPSIAARSGTSAHVYVQVDDAGGNGVGFLSMRHFTLSSAGQPLSFGIKNATISRKAGSKVPRNYLLVLPPPFPPEEMKEPCRAFASVLKAGWRVRMVDPSGSRPETIPCTMGQVRHVIRVVHGPEMDAVKQLGVARGRRVVLYFTSQTHVLGPVLQKAANDAGAMVYDVGGRETYFVDEQEYAPYTAPTWRAAMHAGAFALDEPGPYYVAQRGVARPEGSIRSALSDATKRARGFYELTTKLPGPAGELTLGLKKMPSGLMVTAQVLVDDGEAPGLVIEQ